MFFGQSKIFILTWHVIEKLISRSSIDIVQMQFTQDLSEKMAYISQNLLIIYSALIWSYSCMIHITLQFYGWLAIS